MKRLTENEINFMKDTGFTWTVWQCDEWHRTPFKNYDEATDCAREEYGVDLDNLMHKFEEYDGISLEYTATYLFYSFFTREELENLSPTDGLEWLRDMRYFCGYRKWDEWYVEQEIQEALEIYGGTRDFYELERNGEIWHREKEN